MNDIWFEEDLVPTSDIPDEIINELSKGKDADELLSPSKIFIPLNGVVRVDKPRWGKLNQDFNLLTSTGNVSFFLIRLGFQFDLPNNIREKGFHFIFVRCEAYLWSTDNQATQPRVYDVIPKNLVEGERRKVSVKVGPEIKVNEIGGSIGEVSSDFYIGYITPSIIGWPGEDERTPYWELRPVTKELLGTQHLWALIEYPNNLNGFRISVRVEAQIQTLFGAIAIGPKERIWKNRPSIFIS